MLMPLESVVPKDHPFRSIKARVNGVVKSMNLEFESMYAREGHSSIPPDCPLQRAQWAALLRTTPLQTDLPLVLQHCWCALTIGFFFSGEQQTQEASELIAPKMNLGR